MSLNTDFQVERKEVSWQGQVAGTVRGLTPHDIMKVIAENPQEADMVMEMLESDARDALPDEDASADDIATALQGTATKSFGKMVAKVPDLVAKLIAVACDSPDQWTVVRDRFVVPLQFEMAQEIARLTFVDPPSFRRFLGNVMALVGAFKGDQRQSIASTDSDG